MFKICNFGLFFILIIFVATSGVVSSSSLYNSPVSNNIEKAFATTDHEQEQQQDQEQLCAEGEVFNEETQTCEAIEQEQQQDQEQLCAEGEVFNEETQTCEAIEQEQQQDQEQLCAEGEVFNEETQTCEAIEQEQQQDQEQLCAEGEVFNEETQTCEAIEQEQQQDQEQLCAEGEVFNEETQTCEAIEQEQQQDQEQLCAEGEVFNEETQTCEAIEQEQQQDQEQLCAEGEVFNNGTGLCEPAVEDITELPTQEPITIECAEGEVFNNATGLCELAEGKQIAQQQPCPLGQVFNNATSTCEVEQPILQQRPTCPSGQILNNATGTCDYSQNIPTTTCPQGQIFINATQTCIPTITCPQGQVFNNSTQTCQQPDTISCPQGQVFNNSTQTCQQPDTISCPQGQVFNNSTQTCQQPDTISCPQGQVFNNSTQTCQQPDTISCPQGQVFNNSTQTCQQPDTISCPQGQVFNNATGVCESPTDVLTTNTGNTMNRALGLTTNKESISMDKVNLCPTEVYKTKWSKGWSSIASFTMNSQPYLFSYKIGDGSVAIDKVNPGGKSTTEVYKTKWSKGWSSIASFTTGGQPYIFAYKIGDGSVAIDKVNPGGKSTTEVYKTKWSKGWSSIASFTTGGQPYIFAYKIGDGSVAIDKVNPGGKSTTEVYKTKWSKGWSSIASFTMNSQPYLFSYKIGDGSVAIDKVNPGGKSTTEVYKTKWSKGWSSIASFTTGGQPYIFAYKIGDGSVAIDKVNPGGKSTTEVYKTKWSKGWSSIASFTMNSQPYLFSYKIGDGSVAIDKIGNNNKCPPPKIDLPPNEDSDGDGLLNSWEQKGYDINNDRRIDLNLPGFGANPQHKDVFVEIDFMKDHRPDAKAISHVIASFAAAPVSNPDGKKGITLHVLVDNQITHQDIIKWQHLQTIKKYNFGTAAERANTNNANIIKAKTDVYHYALFVHDFLDDEGEGGSIGLGEFPGDDFLVSLGKYGWGDSDGNGHENGSIDQQESTFMHELGHNLKLDHGGRDGINNKPNYISVMNYLYDMPSLVAHRSLDYSRCVIHSLNENSLNERTGIGASCPRGLSTYIKTIDHLTKTETPIDYNGDHLTTGTGIAKDLNGETPRSTLNSYNDWANILYNFREKPAGGASLVSSGAASLPALGEYGSPPPSEPEPSLEDLKQDRLSLLKGIERHVQTLPPTAFKTPEAAGEAKRALIGEIRTSPTESIAGLLNTGNLDGAIQELTQLKGTANSSKGEAALNNFIAAPQAQQELEFLVDNLIQTLEKQK